MSIARAFTPSRKNSVPEGLNFQEGIEKGMEFWGSIQAQNLPRGSLSNYSFLPSGREANAKNKTQEKQAKRWFTCIEERTPAFGH